MDSKNEHHSRFPKIEEMTKEEIRKTMIKKRETNAKAQKVVETLLEPGISKESFINSLPHINQCHMDDIVEERAIVRICGYPPCHKMLSATDIPKQQYRISIRTNKVYDITARKNFCSNICYRATCYVKNQMLTSPLWFREYEKIPNFQLMPADTTGSMGKELDLSIIEKIEKETTYKEKLFTSINQFASASFNEIDMSAVLASINQIDTESQSNATQAPNKKTLKKEQANEMKAKSNPINIHEKCKHQTIYGLQSQKDLADQLVHGANAKEIEKIQCKQLKDEHENTANNPNTLNKNKKSAGIIGKIVEKPEKIIDPIIIEGNSEFQESKNLNNSQTNKSRINEDPILKLIIHIEKCVAEWFTLDSMIFIFGEKKVKEMVADKGDCIKEYLNNMANGLFYSATSYDQYQQLCRKLNMLELEDHRYESRETKPLPDYSILQEESKGMQLKVKAFLSGECEILKPNETIAKQNLQEDSSHLTQLALVDNNAQNALRRKIFLRNLNKILHDLQCSLGIQGISIATDVRLLVNTFRLKANNIMFKPIQWPLIGVIIIKLLSLRDLRMQQQLETAKADENLQLLMLSYKQDGGYISRLILWLTDIDRLLDTDDRQLTVN